MARKHAFLIAIFLGLAAAVGAVAAINTARLGGPQAKAVSAQSQSAQLQRRSRLLNSQAASLRRALAKRPPKLPKVPAFSPAEHATAPPRRRRPRRLRHGCSTSAPPR